MVDIVGIVKSYGDMQEITLQKQGGRVLQKRELQVLDDSATEVTLFPTLVTDWLLLYICTYIFAI